MLGAGQCCGRGWPLPTGSDPPPCRDRDATNKVIAGVCPGDPINGCAHLNLTIVRKWAIIGTRHGCDGPDIVGGGALVLHTLAASKRHCKYNATMRAHDHQDPDVQLQSLSALFGHQLAPRLLRSSRPANAYEVSSTETHTVKRKTSGRFNASSLRLR